MLQISFITALRYSLPRRYARWRLGVTHEEAHSYNITDRVLLTFDDYGSETTVRGVLDILEKEGVKAAFFLQGDWSGENPELVQEVTQRGHWLGNHSYSHPQLDTLSDEGVRSELHRGLESNLLRPPYGAYNDHIRQIAAQYGFKISFWTIDSWDWRGLSAKQMQRLILPRLHKGACILLHLNAPNTLEALPGLIAGIRARGYELCHTGTEIQA
jgi:peptidoglycan/xylan/chitin deacetylase (PgdA/CDA1 family)